MDAMKHALLSLLFSMLATLAHASHILVYSGTCVETDNNISAKARTKKVFVIFSVPDDLTAQSLGNSALLFYGNTSSGKKYLKLTYSLRSTFVVRPDSKRIGSFSMASVQDVQSDPVFYLHDTFYFRGLETLLPIEMNGNMSITANHPKTLKGSGTYAGLGLINSSLVTRSFSLKYDQARTLLANAGNKTVAQVLLDLESYVITLGYSF